MKFETAADRDVFFADGDAATYTLDGGGGCAVMGHFSRPLADQLVGDETEVAGGAASFLMSSDRVPAGASAAGGDRLTLDGVVWRVRKLEPEGDGKTTRLSLSARL